MFPNISPVQQLSKKERELCKFYKTLGDNERETLLSFAEFLSVKYTASEATEEVDGVLQLPILIEAPENESVIKGIKRLKASYFMIDDENLLHEVSALMSEHVMKGVSAHEVIQKVEAVFKKFYQQYKDNFAKEHQGIE
jgi:hypothetical protein